MDGNFTVILVLFSYVILGILIISLFFDKKRLQCQQNDLLNRLMSKNYVEYTQMEAHKVVKPPETKTTPLLEEQDVFSVD